jgi:hypothetical protein
MRSIPPEENSAAVTNVPDIVRKVKSFTVVFEDAGNF